MMVLCTIQPVNRPAHQRHLPPSLCQPTAWLVIGLLTGLMLCLPQVARAEHTTSQELFSHLAVSGTIQASRGNNVRYREAVAALRLPWHRALNPHWQLETLGLIGVGRLSGGNDTSRVYSLGLQVSIEPHHYGLYLSGASRVARLDDGIIGRINLGGRLQFLSFAEAGWRLVPHLSAGVRILHISNGGITDINPGINLISVVINIHP